MSTSQVGATGPETNTTVPPPPLPRATKLAITTLVIGAIAAILDSTMVTLAIHRLTVDLHSTTATIQWVTTAYLLALGVAVPMTGWLERRIGGKRAWMLALLIFGTASVLCALSWNATSLIIFRAAQGIGGGLIMPLMQTLAIRAVGHRPSPNLIATISMPAALGPILGPVVGGAILNWLSWRWLFLVNAPIVIVALVMAWKYLASDPPAADQSRPRLDWLGLCLLAPALVGVLLGFSQTAQHGGLDHPGVLIPLSAGILLLVGFIIWALRSPDPLVNVRLMRVRSMFTASSTLFTAGAAMYAGMFLLPLYFQVVQGRSVLEAGLLMIAQGVGALLIRFVTGKLVDRFGGRAVTVAAFLVSVIGTVPFAFADHDTSLVWLTLVLFVRGLGIGAVLIPPMTLAYQDVGPKDVAHASMNTRIMQQVGASFGTAIVAVVLQFVALHATSSDTAFQAFHMAFWWAVGISLLALVPAFALPGPKQNAAPSS